MSVYGYGYGYYDTFYGTRYGPLYSDPGSYSFAVTYAEPKAKPEPKFKAADKVKITIDSHATVSYASSTGTTVSLTLADGTTVDNVPVKHVKLAGPVGWPPKKGQVWKADGKLFGVRENNVSGAVAIYPVADGKSSGNTYCDSYSVNNRTLEAFKELRPTLVG